MQHIYRSAPMPKCDLWNSSTKKASLETSSCQKKKIIRQYSESVSRSTAKHCWYVISYVRVEFQSPWWLQMKQFSSVKDFLCYHIFLTWNIATSAKEFLCSMNIHTFYMMFMLCLYSQHSYSLSLYIHAILSI